MQLREYRTGDFLAKAGELIRNARQDSAIFVLGMATIGTILDVTGHSENTAGVAFNIASIFAGFALSVAMLRRSDLLAEGQSPSFLVYFGLTIVSGLAMVLGFLLLIVPGILLIVRWLPMYGFLMVSGSPIAQSMGQAWRATSGHFWRLFLGSLASLVLLAIVGGTYSLAIVTGGAGAIAGYAIANVAIFGLSLFWTAYGFAAFVLLGRTDEQLQTVFE